MKKNKALLASLIINNIVWGILFALLSIIGVGANQIFSSLGTIGNINKIMPPEEIIKDLKTSDPSFLTILAKLADQRYKFLFLALLSFLVLVVMNILYKKYKSKNDKKLNWLFIISSSLAVIVIIYTMFLFSNIT